MALDLPNRLSLRADLDQVLELALEREPALVLAPELALALAVVVAVAAALVCMASAVERASKVLLAAPQELARRPMITTRNACEQSQGGRGLECD